MGQAVGDHQHHPPGVGQPAQHAHHLAIQRRIQPGSRFIQDQQRWPGQQFHSHRGAFALSAREFVDAGVGMAGQLQFLEDSAHRRGALVGGGVRQPQFGGEAQGRIHGQLVMHHVVLGNQPDPVAQRRILAVQVTALETHLARGRGDGPAHQFGQRRLARTGWADDRGQRPGPRAKRDIAQQLAPVRQRQTERMHVQAIDLGRGRFCRDRVRAIICDEGQRHPGVACPARARQRRRIINHPNRVRGVPDNIQDRHRPSVAR
jgi:hypothetical protein